MGVQKLVKAIRIQLISVLKLVLGLFQCSPLGRMILEYNVVMPMAVHVYVRLELNMMELVKPLITKAITCIDYSYNWLTTCPVHRIITYILRNVL